MQINFKGTDCILHKLKYVNGRTALELTEAETGESFLTVSKNIPTENLSSNEIIIKDYSENDGILRCLAEIGVISYPKRWITQGWVSLPICDLLI